MKKTSRLRQNSTQPPPQPPSLCPHHRHHHHHQRSNNTSSMATLLLVTAAVVAALLPCSRAQDVQLKILEEQQPKTFVGNVAREINLQAQLPSSIFDSLQYNILAGSNSDGSLFSVNQDTGDLFTARRLDRETQCRFSLQCQLDFKVGAVSNDYFKNIKVRILLEDINDNAPRFNRSTMSLDIAESVTIGASFSLEGALDDDTGPNNSVQGYTLLPGDGPFRVTSTQKLDRTSDVTLIVREQLDRETQSSYTLRLVASDGGTPLRTAEMIIEVTVTDNNDNTPVFSQTSYSVTIGENVRPGQSILAVSATDVDEGANAEIKYHLSEHQGGSVVNLFSVDETSGDVSVLQLPASGRYSFIVQAVDGGSPPKEDQVVVEVNVIDTTNNPPVIVVTLLSEAVSEGIRLKSPVAHVSVEDPDSGSNGQVKCYSQSADFKLSDLEESDRMVRVARSLDREDTPSYRVALLCQDNGSPSLSATATFTIIVEDVNDNPPVFDKKEVSVSVQEGDRVGEIIHTVIATDRDIGQNAEISYSILNADRVTAFYVLEASGSIVVAEELDRETVSVYVLEIQAVDGGSPQFSSTMTLTINVEDVNDEVPVFVRDEYVFTIMENQPAGTVVGIFNATDPDLGEGGKVRFSLDGGQPQASASFLLQPNGTLITRGMLDRESSPEIVFDVTASDRGSPALSSFKEVKVVLEDSNDNKPVFIFPGPSNHSLTLLIPIKADSHLFRLNVIDADEGQNSLVAYAIASPNLTSLFSVDRWTGDVWSKKALTEDLVGVYNLTFRATDNGLQPLSSASSLFITIKPNPDSQPVKSGDNNAVIAISIVCATLFIAAIIVVVVILVRRRDKGKELHYVNKLNGSNHSSEKGKAGGGDPYIERQNTPSMFFTSSSGGSHMNGGAGTVSPKLSIGYPHEPGRMSRSSADSPHWDPDPLGRDFADGGDLQTLNRVTSLRLQQAFEHISSIKSQLITANDTGKPYEWREIHVPGRPEDFTTNSLSSRGTTVNGDSGMGGEEDVFLNSLPNPHPHANPHGHPHGHPYHPLHNTSGGSGGGNGGGGYPRKPGTRSLSQPASDHSHDSSQQSCSSLPNLYLKPGSDILVFRPTSATSCESSPSMDDNCTTTSGSYSITAEDHHHPLHGRGLGMDPGGRDGRRDLLALDADFNHVQDVYV